MGFNSGFKGLISFIIIMNKILSLLYFPIRHFGLLNILVQNNYESIEKSEFYDTNKKMGTHGIQIRAT